MRRDVVHPALLFAGVGFAAAAILGAVLIYGAGAAENPADLHGSFVVFLAGAALYAVANTIGFVAAALLAPPVARSTRVHLLGLTVVVALLSVFNPALLVPRASLILLAAPIAPFLATFLGLKLGLRLSVLRSAAATDRCPDCGYALEGASSDRCPECGGARPDLGATP